VKADLDAGGADPSHGSLGWDLGSSRKAWNRAKGGVAPWSADNSKRGLLVGLGRSRGRWTTGTPARPAPIKAAGWVSPGSNPHGVTRAVRFTTEAMRLEPDRRTIMVPRIGGLRSNENIRRVQLVLAAGS